MEIVAVDTWDDRYLVRNKEYIADYKRQMGHIMEMYNYNLQAAGVRHIVTDVRERSHLAAKRFEDCYFDVVFIDADHRVENVIRDIIAWLPKVKSGGIISGHDYTPDTGVPDAVRRVFGDRFLTMETAVWYISVNSDVRGKAGQIG